MTMTPTTKIALVTGGSRGIGRSCVLQLASEGYYVVFTWNSQEERAKEVIEAVEKAGGNTVALQADVSCKDDIEELFAIIDRLGSGLDLVVNNAGIYTRTTFNQLDEEVWDRTVAVNLKGVYLVCKAAVPLMEGKPNASIVNVSSQLASVGTTHGAHYAATKGGLESFSHSLALELAPGIRVNIVAPGPIETDIIATDTPEKRLERETVIPMGRVGQPEEIANAVSFLASDRSGFITGSTIHVNGGLYLN